MNRLFATAAGLAVLAAAGAASAGTQVNVAIGPELQRHAPVYGQREVNEVAQELQKTVQKALDKKGADAPARVDLVLEAATPNRPTFDELGSTTGLSMRSIGVGGAAISGTVTKADGTTQPLAYRWYETDLRNVIGYGTWTDAERAFDGLARRLSKGQAPNDGPYHPDLQAKAAFDSLNRLR